MKILDLQTGRVHEYGDSGHDSLYVSQDGTTLTYYNLQTGDGSKYGDYRFVCDDNKIPAESQTADARHCEVYFNIGGWPERPHVESVPVSERLPDNDGGCYLVSLDNGQIVVADSGGIIENHDFEPRMLAWQPLPEPYKEGGKE